MDDGDEVERLSERCKGGAGLYGAENRGQDGKGEYQREEEKCGEANCFGGQCSFRGNGNGDHGDEEETVKRVICSTSGGKSCFGTTSYY